MVEQKTTLPRYSRNWLRPNSRQADGKGGASCNVECSAEDASQLRQERGRLTHAIAMGETASSDAATAGCVGSRRTGALADGSSSTAASAGSGSRERGGADSKESVRWSGRLAMRSEPPTAARCCAMHWLGYSAACCTWGAPCGGTGTLSMRTRLQRWG